MIRSLSLRRLVQCASALLPALFILSATAHAQQPPKLDIPSGPLLQAAPSFAKWIITFSYPEDRQNAAPGAPAPPPPPPSPDDELRTRKITTTKTKKIIREETINLKGDRAEKWYAGNTEYWKKPGTSQWLEIPSDIDEDTHLLTGNRDATPLPPSGFRDLEWVGSKTYVGTIAYGSHTCFVFIPEGLATKDLYNPDTLLTKVPTLTQAAFIDAETRYPVEVRMGNVYELYQFETQPTEMQTLPTDLVTALQKAAEARAKLGQGPPRPY